MLHSTVSRKGGQARSPKKTRANRAKAAAFWEAVREHRIAPPRRYRKPPGIDEIRQRLASYCRHHGIIRLDVFGSIARGEGRPGSDVDLIAEFDSNPGLRFFVMEEEISALLGVPAHLLTRDSVKAMPNRLRREAILADARAIYHAKAES